MVRALRLAVALIPWMVASGWTTLALDADLAAQAETQVRTLMSPSPPAQPRTPLPHSKDVTYAPGEKVPS